MARPHSAGFNRNEIVFRILLQREEAQPSLTFGALGKSLPTRLSKPVEQDWRAYIRDEGLHFAHAFQKAIRKNVPGVYYAVMALEFLHQLPFHVALSHLLETSPLPTQINLQQSLELADYLAEEIRIERRNAQAASTPFPDIDIRYQEESRLLGGKPKKKCWVCDKFVPAADFCAHVADHLKPPTRAVTAEIAPATPVVVPQPRQVPVPYAVTPEISSEPRFARFTTGRCIDCGGIPIPGDHYCYIHAPE